MSEQRRLAHVERIPIRWGDMDAMGHVNNTVYFRFMEQARIGWFDRLAPDARTSHHVQIVIARATCNYRRAITYPGVVEVKLFVGAPGGASVPTYYELRVDADPEPYADGEAMVVFVDAHTQKSQRIPAQIRARLERAPAEA